MSPGRIDAHHHLWNPGTVDYPWLGPELAPIDGPMELDRLTPLLQANGIGAGVLVQSQDSDEDTDYMLAAAADEPAVAAVVGWVPLERPADAERRLDALAGHRKLRGIRVAINWLPDTDWLLQPAVAEGLDLLARRDLPFDVVGVRRRHLELVPELSERHPSLRLVLDHLSKPPIGKDEDWVRGWKQNLARAAENPNVFAKLSGLFPARGKLDEWDAEDVRPFFAHALECFGADRLMWGSDWPIAELAGGYEKVVVESERLFAELSEPERDALWGGTATRFYGLANGAV